MSIQNWCEEIIKNLNKEKKIILIVGASSSGKSTCTEILENKLKEEGKRVAKIPIDMYYKGISRIITEKAYLNNKEFIPFLDKAKDIIKVVIEVTEFEKFADKFSDENVEKIKTKLRDIVPYEIAEKMTIELKNQILKMNFDEPFAIDFKKFSRDINKGLDNKNIIIPTYSFVTGEVRKYKKDLINLKDFDYIIVEGLYALRDEILDDIDKKFLVKTAIDCDLKTLLIRRFNRDIKSGRCSYTSEHTIMAFINNVMPAYFQYIYPTLKNADIILETALTKKEIENREKSLQYKFSTNKNMYNLLEMKGAKLLDIQNHKDYFLEESSKKSNDIILRLREEGGKASKLTIKIKTENDERAVEEYDLEKDLSTENRNIESLLARFKNSGYEVSQIIKKNRRTYELNGLKIKVDDVNNLGFYIEIDGDYKKSKDLQKQLLLEDPCNSSYYDIAQHNLPVHNEAEVKFLAKGLSESDFKYKFIPQNIKQYYLDLEDQKLIALLKDVFKNISLNISEARLRQINNKDYVLTLKSKGSYVRREIEKEIPITVAKELMEFVISKVEKTRYKILDQEEKSIEIDFYKDRDLCIIEIEYDWAIPVDKIIEFGKNFFGDSVELKNVTEDSNLKNKNLALKEGKINASR